MSDFNSAATFGSGQIGPDVSWSIPSFRPRDRVALRPQRQYLKGQWQ